MRFLLFLFSLIPAVVFADNSVTQGSSLSLAPPSSDLSVSLLASIFGVVQGVLHGTGSQILGAMFGIYNSIILAMGMIILMYTFIVGTLNTAHEGEVMGKKWSSIWLPARTFGGVALLLPNAAGYSLIQIMVMWVVVQGVGAADLVWAKTLNYLARGGVIVQPPMGIDVRGAGEVYDSTKDKAWLSADMDDWGDMGKTVSKGALQSGKSAQIQNAWLVPVAGNIFKSEVCMYALQNIVANQSGKSPNFGSSLKPESVGQTKYRIFFPGTVNIGDGVDYRGMCGSVMWDKAKDAIEVPNATVTNPQLNTILTDSRSVAVQQIIADVQAQAMLVANHLVPLKNQTVSGSLGNLLISNTLYYASLDYIGIMAPYLNFRSTEEVTAINNFVTESKQVGWILAGAYYKNIADLKQQNKTTDSASAIESSFPNLADNSFLKSLSSKLTAGAITTATCEAGGQSSIIDSYICNIEYATIKGNGEHSQANPMVPKAAAKPPSSAFQDRDRKKKPHIFMSIVTLGVADCIQNVNNVFAGMGDIYNAQSINGNPIIMVATLGVSLVDAVESIYISSLAVIFLLVVVGGITVLGTGAGVASAFISVLLWILPFATMILAPLLVAGATMAYYVPMIPFILFIFGALTWFASVIEAMLAAPLVALGLAHPEGHELLGKAEYAVMLLANVFLRPLLMIFGFIAATILSSVMLWLLNYGFTQAFQGAGSPDMLRMVYFIATIVIYMSLVLTIINKSFALIYEVPSKVLRWVGGQVEPTGEGAALDEVKGGVSKGFDTMGSTADKAWDHTHKGASQALDAAEKKGEKRKEEAKEAAKAAAGPEASVS